MPLPIHLALVPIAKIKFNDVAQVSAAIQKQLIRDFSPIWGIEATIDAFPALDDVPVGYWPICIVDTFDKGGQHKTLNNQPFGLVAAGKSWSLAASHEALEMLVDPDGNRLVAGTSPADSQTRVEFLLEVCDPCQSERESIYGERDHGVGLLHAGLFRSDRRDRRALQLQRQGHGAASGAGRRLFELA